MAEAVGISPSSVGRQGGSEIDPGDRFPAERPIRKDRAGGQWAGQDNEPSASYSIIHLRGRSISISMGR